MTIADEAGDIGGAVRTFLGQETSLGDAARTLPAGHDLIANGVMDSMTVLKLLSFIEDRYKIVVADEDIVRANFASIAAVERLVVAKVGGDRRDSTRAP